MKSSSAYKQNRLKIINKWIDKAKTISIADSTYLAQELEPIKNRLTTIELKFVSWLCSRAYSSGYRQACEDKKRFKA